MIGIIVLNYINWNDTLRCVNSILNSEVKVKYKIYIVDNASPNTCKSEIENLFKDEKIEIIYNDKNNGYSSGNNIGIIKAIEQGCKQILISNNDVIFKKDSIYNMYSFLEKNSYVGIVGPKIYTENGEIQAINMGIKMSLKGKYLNIMNKTIFKFLSKKFMNKFCISTENLEGNFEVFAVSGCCFMISEKCVKDITPFDENTFLYEEENIIGCCMEEKGYKTVYNTESEIVHLHGKSTDNIKAFSYICFVESELYYCKYYLKSSKIKIIPLYLIRSSKYILEMIRNEDYRQNFKIYLKKTLKMLLK